MTFKIHPPAPVCHVAAASLLPGSIIHPPARELRLWMCKHAAEYGYDASWLTLHVTSVEPSSRAGFVLVRARQPREDFLTPWAFIAKASTMWPVVSLPPVKPLAPSSAGVNETAHFMADA